MEALFRVRMVELLRTIPELQPLTCDPITSFEAWIGITDDGGGPSIEDETSPPSDLFFASLIDVIQWAYSAPVHPLHSKDDFQMLESIRVTKWLSFCMDLKIDDDASFASKLMACDAARHSFVDALFHHVDSLSQLQSAQNIFIQSLRQNLGLFRTEQMSKIQSTTDQLQNEMDLHIQQLESILGEIYQAATVPIRGLIRERLATYWHSFVIHSSCGGGMVHENTLALGVAMTLRLLLRILKGSTTIVRSHEHLLMNCLLPLHQPNSMVLWRDQRAILELYHEPLVQCMAVLIQKNPAWISPVLDAILKPPIWTVSNTPKCILLLHEIDLVLKVLPESEPLHAWTALHSKLTWCMASDNSRLSERSMQFFRNDRFQTLFYSHIEESLPSLLKSTVKPNELPWNPTVRKMLYNILNSVREKDEAAFSKACRHAFEGIKKVENSTPIDSVAHVQSLDSVMSPIAPENSNKRTSKKPDFSLRAGMGDWRPPKRNHPGLPPTSPYGRHTMVGTGVETSRSSSMAPPLTVTGVAPWASQAPSTVAAHSLGVGRHQREFFGSKATTSLSNVEESSEPHDTVNNTALQAVLKFMEDIKPAGKNGGVSVWSKVQMEESPTLLPSLKFHDLVFGHVLGSGAFGVVKYARRIDQSTTRSHWAEYAVKIISTQKILEMGYEPSVRREIAILRIMSHPGIARLISTFRFKDGAYLVLEYASRGDLHMLLRHKGSLDHESTRFVIGEVLAALTSIHELGFIYGDLKTENTLITETGHIKLTDFGASRPYTAEAKEMIQKDVMKPLEELRDGDWKPSKDEKVEAKDSTAVGWQGKDDDQSSNPEDEECYEDLRIEGTIAYLPPEVVLGAFPTPAADMWALGCVLYQCLTGRPPLLDDDEQMTRQKIVSFDHRPSGQCDSLFADDHAKDIQDDAKELIRKLLHRDSRQRITTSQAAEDAFFRGQNVFAMYREPAYPLDVGTVAPEVDAKWARRQLSSIWAPQPHAYDISTTNDDEVGLSSIDSSKPIPEGDERASFFSFRQRSGLLNEIQEAR